MPKPVNFMIAEYKYNYRNECVDIFLDNYLNPPFNYEWMNYDKITRYFIDMENTPNFFGFTFLESKRVVGLCFGMMANYFDSATYEISEILVRRELQGKGFGSIALAKIEAILKSSGVSAVTLNTNSDLQAAEFYKKNGYEIAPKAIMLIKPL